MSKTYVLLMPAVLPSARPGRASKKSLMSCVTRYLQSGSGETTSRRRDLRRERAAGSGGRQQQREDRPASGATAHSQSVVSRSTASATAPRKTAAIPPRPIERPIYEPGRHADVLRHVLLAHHHRHPECADDGGADDDERDRAGDSAGEDERRSQAGRRDSTRGAPGAGRSGRRRGLRAASPPLPRGA